MENCADCHKPASELYQRVTDRKFVCFACLPAKQVDQYPGWRDREAAKRRKAAQARDNFGKAEARSQKPESRSEQAALFSDS